MSDDPFATLAPIPAEAINPPAEGSQRSLPWFAASSLAGQPVPDRLWNVQDWIPSRDITLWGGDGGTGKSLLAFHLSCCTALGRPWLGRAVTSGGAIYVSAEDDRAELHRRLDAIARAEGVGMEELDRLTVLSLAGRSAILAAPQPRGNLLAATSLFTDLEARVAEERPTIVCLDTLSDMWSGDENNRAQARQFIGLLRGLALRQGCALVLLAHPSLTGLSNGTGLSGSTAWSNSVRSRLTLERLEQDGFEADPDRRRLIVKKANYAARGAEIFMRFEGGVFVPEGGDAALDHRAASAKARRVFLDLLRLYVAQSRKVSAAPGANFAPSIFEAHPDAEGVTKRGFKLAMERLLAEGKLEVREDGPPSKRRNFIAEAEK